MFYQLLGITAIQMEDRFDVSSTDLSTYLELGSVLSQGKTSPHDALVRRYPDLDCANLSTQLAMFDSHQQRGSRHEGDFV